MTAHLIRPPGKPFKFNRRQAAPMPFGRPGSSRAKTARFFLMTLCLTAVMTALHANPAPAAERPAVTVFAAASTSNVITSINALFEEKGLGRVAVSFAASSTLAKQIDNGAPADLFLSASSEWMDYLVQRQLIEPSSRRDLLSNRIVLIAPASSPLEQFQVTKDFPLAAILGQDRLAMGDPSHTPSGIYSRQALSALGLWTSVADKIAPAKDVRSALMLVERGEAPLGLVYSTDAAISKQVRVLAVFPADGHSPITYPVALVKGRTNETAMKYLEFIEGSQARKVFETYGFIVR